MDLSLLKAAISRSVCVAVVLMCASGLDGADPSEMTVDNLIAKLKSPNAAPVIDKSRAWRATFPSNYDRAAQAGVLNGWKELHARFEEALPSLVAHVNDNDYCVTIELGSSGAQRNRSVGEVCEYLIRLHIEAYTRPLHKNPIHQEFLLSFDDRERPQYPVAIKNWWAKRKSKSLAELQLEAVQWQIDNYSPAETFEFGRIPKDRIERELQHLNEMKDQLETNGKLSKPPKWRGIEEFRVLDANP